MDIIQKSYEEYIESIEDPETAHAVAQALLVDTETPKLSPGVSQVGRKRFPGIKKYNLAPLPGCKESTSKKIRAIVGLRYSGFNNMKIERMLGFSNKYIHTTEVRHPDAFEEAKQDLMRETLSEYYGNLLVIRGALSRAGHKAVQTLAEVVDDKKAAPGIRVKAANSILELINIKGAGKTSTPSDIIDSLTNFYEHTRDPKFSGDVIVDAQVEEAMDGLPVVGSS